MKIVSLLIMLIYIYIDIICMHNIMLYILHIPFYLKLIKSFGGFPFVYFFFFLLNFITNRPFCVEVKKGGKPPPSQLKLPAS